MVNYGHVFYPGLFGVHAPASGCDILATLIASMQSNSMCEDCVYRNEYENMIPSPISLNTSKRLYIALSMRSDDIFSYKYNPTHYIMNEVCMIVQTRVFDIGAEVPKQIHESQYDNQNHNHVKVREIIFSSHLAPTNLPHALYFGINDNDVYVLTEAEKKRIDRFKKKSVNDISFQQWLELNPLNKPIILCPTIDKDCHGLFTEALQFLYLSLLLQQTATASLDIIAQSIEAKFDSLLNHFAKQTWPVNFGREFIDENTPVPRSNTEYYIAMTTKSSFAYKIWSSFLKTVSI